MPVPKPKKNIARSSRRKSVKSKSTPGYSSEKAERLEARISPESKAHIQRAADIEGRTLTDFIVNASQSAAKKVIEEYELIRLTAEGSKNFILALTNPPKPSSALKKAAKRYRQYMQDKD